MCLCPLKRIVSGELENRGSKGDLDSKRTEARDWPRSHPGCPAVILCRAAASLQLRAAWGENCRRRNGITQKVCFF